MMKKMFPLGLVLFLCLGGLSAEVWARGANQPQAVQAVQAKVNINTATTDELQAVQGVGPVLAERVIAYRNENGKFQQIEDMVKVRGIGQSKFDKIKDQITL